jgi:hypothetical protein
MERKTRALDLCMCAYVYVLRDVGKSTVDTSLFIYLSIYLSIYRFFRPVPHIHILFAVYFCLSYAVYLDSRSMDVLKLSERAECVEFWCCR